MITSEELAATEGRAAAAPPGPWYVDRGGEVGARFFIIAGVVRDPYGDNALNCGSDEMLAEFIAHARTDVPRLIAALRASRARVAELEVQLDKAQLRSIEARNPGIDIREVDRFRKCPRNPCQCGHHRDRT